MITLSLVSRLSPVDNVKSLKRLILHYIYINSCNLDNKQHYYLTSKITEKKNKIVHFFERRNKKKKIISPCYKISHKTKKASKIATSPQLC